jgi:hypothetical protein
MNIEKFFNNKGNFECGKGWYTLLENFKEDLLTLIDEEQYDFDIEVVQVKEKFGGLRIYLSSSVEAIDNLIDEYVDVAYHTCELCGEKGKLRMLDDGWMATLCDDHYDYYSKVKQTE